MKKTKAQFSLEFLTTYGWAILAVLVAIGALAYSGAIDPSKFTKGRCMISPELRCNDYRITLNSTNAANITIRLTNMNPSKIVVVSVNFSTKKEDPTKMLANCTASVAAPITIDSEYYADFTSRCQQGTGNMFVGDKKKIDVEVYYYTAKSGVEYTNVVSGEIFDTVQQI